MTKPAETTVMQHWFIARWEDRPEEKEPRIWNDWLIWPSRERALHHAAEMARLQGAPGQALVVDEYDISYMIDMVRVIWRTPVGAEQPADVKAIDPRFRDLEVDWLKPRVVVSQRLGNIPR